MSPGELEARFRRLLDAQRARCLWHVREDFIPDDDAGRLMVLDAIQRRGDLEAYREAGVLKAWLSHGSRQTSAGSSPTDDEASGRPTSLALNEVLAQPRLSRDIDVFHDTQEALRASWDGDLALLLASGFDVEVVRERQAFVEATVRRAGEAVTMEWSQDSAYRFFPLVEHPVLGLTLHPVDLATNKVLALAGRREPRDLIDTLACIAEVQPLGYLAWAAAGKDPGLGPALVISEAARRARYAQSELDALDFGDAAPPDATEVMSRWHAAVDEASAVLEALPAETAGRCVLEGEALARRTAAELPRALHEGRLVFHEGRIGGAFPRIV